MTKTTDELRQQLDAARSIIDRLISLDEAALELWHRDLLFLLARCSVASQLSADLARQHPTQTTMEVSDRAWKQSLSQAALLTGSVGKMPVSSEEMCSFLDASAQLFANAHQWITDAEKA